ncbi:MAG: ATP-dependent Clp protease ATP-binding subunit [bacterium]|nr:ATP-dependent Clp protease ATP-binding subunit [bacterium]
MPDVPAPPPTVYFDHPYFRLSPFERHGARFAFRLLFGIALAIMGLLLYAGFPRFALTAEVEDLFRFSFEGLMALFNAEFSLGLLIAFFLAHEAAEYGRGADSLIALARKRAIPDRINGADFLHPDTHHIIEHIIDHMRDKDIDALIPAVLGETLTHPRLQKAFAYLEIDRKAFAADLKNLQGILDYEFEPEKLFSYRSQVFQRILREGMIEASRLGHEYVMPEDLMLAVLDEDIQALKTFLARWNIGQDDLRTIARVINVGGRRTRRVGSRRRTVKHQVMNRAWTARPTYALDRYARDLTDLARSGMGGFMIGHNAELGAIIRILNRATKNNVLLMGDAGSGKTTILEYLARLIAREDVPEKLFDKRLVVLDVGTLVAGARTVGDLQARVVSVIDDIIKAENVILAIPDIHTILTAGQNEGISISTVLGPVFAQGAFQVIGLTDAKQYHALIEPHAEFKNHFDMVEVNEIAPDETLEVLAIYARTLEASEDIVVSFPALKKTVELAGRYIHDKLFPAKAIDLLGEGVELAKRNRKKTLTHEDIAFLVSERTGIPVNTVTEAESATLLNLNQELHKRIIDQEEGVNAVADIVRQSRAGVRRQNAPVGSFLFVGPTGVGKTETAKALAEVYFKSDKAMVRFDMSEYQTRESVYRLIGSPDSDSPGQLTERLKHNPYSLLLLDEFEKAHANILDIFLQIFDDGRLTDAHGTTIDFTNAIIIATSNAHSLFILEGLKTGKAVASIAAELKDKLTTYFKPELINRFDEIIVFKPLEPEHILRIAELQLKALFVQLERERGIRLGIRPQATELLTRLGYDPAFGARPLRHVIRKRIRDLVAEEILKNNLGRGEAGIIDVQNGEFTIVKTT